ncbi:hypothetical protein AALP_AA8G322600 [Arabis alpina]|uniref:Wax synthase domain-containing protein n=1 Tax=Arabis alpina TaxID=50452 RepID=A0A087GAV7_ARAAL|nr:hypothetical protein AALP_AA8G322600 [Arabis alpina]
MVSFIEAWSLVMVSLCYTFYIAKLVPKGINRLILIIPVLFIFFIVPFLLSSIHFIGITAFFITWLANFKIILFALGLGPLSSNPRPLSLPIFLAVSCLPIKIQRSPRPPPTSHSHGVRSREGLLKYTIMVALVVLFIKVYDYKTNLPDKALLTLYAIHTWFTLELVLAAAAALVRTMSGLELEPQFNKPYLATSLQDFWGRRWNLMVTGILRPTVYEPIVHVFSFLGPDRSWVPAVYVTFIVSGLMHELMFFYMGRLRPDWKVMWFFLVQAFCTTVEVMIKKTVNNRWTFPTWISRVLTIGFVIGTAKWLFLPAFIQCNIFERGIGEYAAIGEVATRIKKSMITSLYYTT